jgi:hypothetical protein
MAKMPWDIKMAEWIGKALPNEMAKAAPILKYIPYIGWAAYGMGAADAGATTMSDVYQEGRARGLSGSQSRINAMQPTMNQVQAAMGSGTNPGMYGSSGNSIKRNWADYLGLAGGLYGQNSASGIGGNLLNIYDATQSGSDYNTGIDYYNQQPSRNPQWEQYARNILSLASAMKQNQRRA